MTEHKSTQLLELEHSKVKEHNIFIFFRRQFIDQRTAKNCKDFKSSAMVTDVSRSVENLPPISSSGRDKVA